MWTIDKFMQDQTLAIETLKIHELPTLMNLVDAGVSHSLHVNDFPTYVATKTNRTLRGPQKDAAADELLKMSLDDQYEKVAWTKYGIECLLVDKNGVEKYRNTRMYTTNTIEEFIRPLLYSSEKDDMVVKSDSSTLRITPMLRLMVIPIIGIQSLGLSRLPKEDIDPIFTYGLFSLVRQNIIPEDMVGAVSKKISIPTDGIGLKLVESAAAAMEVNLV